MHPQPGADDNEWGYSCRFVDVAAMVARSL